jgi:hypothetical protein
MSDSRRNFNKTRRSQTRRAQTRPAYSWGAATTGSYCNSGDGDCQLIYNLYRNINNNLEDQNKKLDAQFKKVGEVYSTDYQKSNYQNANVMQYKLINSILFWVYYIFVAAIAFIVIKSDSSRTIKVLTVGAFVAYPFLINNIEIILYGVVKYVYAILSGTVYAPPEF